MLAKRKQPLLREILEKRGLDPVKTVAKAIIDAESRDDNPIVPVRTSWINSFLKSYDYRGMKMKQKIYDGDEYEEDIDTIVKKSLNYMVGRIKARSSDIEKQALKIARRKLDYPKELTFYESAIIAKRVGVAPGHLINMVYEGYDPDVDKELGKDEELLEEISKLKNDNKRLKQSNATIKQRMKLINDRYEELLKSGKEKK